MAAVINSDACTQCQACVDVCPVECISGAEDSIPAIDADECIDCGACESECPASAISLD